MYNHSDINELSLSISRSRELINENEVISPHESYKSSGLHGQERISVGVFGDQNCSTQILKDLQRQRNLS